MPGSVFPNHPPKVLHDGWWGQAPMYFCAENVFADERRVLYTQIIIFIKNND